MLDTGGEVLGTVCVTMFMGHDSEAAEESWTTAVARRRRRDCRGIGWRPALRRLSEGDNIRAYLVNAFLLCLARWLVARRGHARPRSAHR